MIHAYHQPSVLDDALRLIAKGSTPIAGATGLYTLKTKRDLSLVDITSLPLNQIVVEGSRIVLGATVTLHQICTAEIPGTEGQLLRAGASSLASRPLQNMVTLGGNIAQLVYWADMPVVLLALDALVEIQKADQAPVTTALGTALEPGTHPWQGGLISRVIVPRRSKPFGFGHQRFSRTAQDYSLATVAATMRLEAGNTTDVRLVIGAIQNRPLRALEAESMLEGKPLTDTLLSEASKALAQSMPISPNYRATVEYRREVLAALTRRALRAAFDSASKEGA